MGNRAREGEWRHAPEARGGFWGFWKSQLFELRPASEEDSWLSLARRSQASGLCGGCRTRWGGRWKIQKRKNVYLSPYVVEPLNSKVIKSFVPELRSRKCFSCFEIPLLCAYLYMSYEHSMSISNIHIHIWIWYTKTFVGQFLYSTANWTIIMWLTVSSLSAHNLH